MVIWISALLLVAAVSGGLSIRQRTRQRARRAHQRCVEQPNSFYSAPGVRRLMDLERWGRIPIEQLHAVNRDEVRRLLRVAQAAGSDALSPSERRFLDNMAATVALRTEPGAVVVLPDRLPESVG